MIRRSIPKKNKPFVNRVCAALINVIMQQYMRGRTSQTLRLLLHRSINTDTLSTEIESVCHRSYRARHLTFRGTARPGRPDAHARCIIPTIPTVKDQRFKKTDFDLSSVAFASGLFQSYFSLNVTHDSERRRRNAKVEKH